MLLIPGQNLLVHRLTGPLSRDVLNFISCFKPVQKTYYFSRVNITVPNCILILEFIFKTIEYDVGRSRLHQFTGRIDPKDVAYDYIVILDRSLLGRRLCTSPPCTNW